MPRAVPSAAQFIHDNDQTIAEAQAAGTVNDELPADRLLDHVLALTIGNLTCRPRQWTDDERHDVGVSVRRLTRPVAEKDATERRREGFDGVERVARPPAVEG